MLRQLNSSKEETQKSSFFKRMLLLEKEIDELKQNMKILKKKLKGAKK